MFQATESGWYALPDGSETFIQKGTVRPSGHPDVLAVPALFDELSDGSVPVVAKLAAPAPAPVAPKPAPPANG